MTEKYAQNVHSEAYPTGGAILLTWEYPSNFNPATDQLIIIRKERVFSEDQTDGDVVVVETDGTTTSFLDENLREATYFYYTWMIYDGTTFWFTKDTQDFELSTKSYNFGSILFAEFPDQQRLLDDETKGGSGDLQRFSNIWGVHFDRMRTEVLAFGYMRSGTQSNPETMPAMAASLGLDKLVGLPLDVLRRATIHAVYVYKRKGSQPGIQLAVKLLTGWDSSLTEARNLIFKTWDGQSRADFGNTYAVSSGIAVDITKSYLVGEWNAALWIDDDRARYTVISSDVSSFTVNKTGDPVFFQVAGNSTSVGFGFLADTTQSLATNFYRNGELIDSAGTHFRIVSNTATQFNFSDPYQKPRAGGYTVRPYWQVMNGDHTLLWNDLDDPCLRGRANDPFSQLYNPSESVNEIGLSNTDVVVTIPGVASTSGFVNTIAPTVLTDTNASWTPNQFVGFNLNPNALQNIEFPIVANTTNTITVASPAAMDALSSAGSRYFVLTPANSVKLKRLRDLLPDFMAFFARPVIFFEPTEC